jgi:hypothetical protein
LADFRLKLAEGIESFGENWVSWEIGLEGFVITWNPVNGKESVKINTLSVSSKVWRNLGNPPPLAAVRSEHGFRRVFHVAFG